MRRPPPLPIVLLLAAGAAFAAGCSRQDRSEGGASSAAPPASTHPAPPAHAPRTHGDPCAPRRPRVTVLGTPPPGAQASARRRVDAAADRLDGEGGRFTTLLEVRVVGAPTAHGWLRGRRTPEGSSEASLHWCGAAGILLPDADLRVVDNRIFVRPERAPGWSDVGSASGIALDVGRELLDHPFLLRTGATAERPTSLTVVLDAEPGALRAYATAERQGPATDLLARARSLSLIVNVSGTRLRSDQFALETVLPSPLAGRLAGRTARVVGSTTYAPLRPADRRAITTPSTTG